MAFVLLLAFPINAFAVSTQKESKKFSYSDGYSDYEYYLDETGKPYIEENGQRVYLLLPLNQFEVTDEAELVALNTFNPDNRAAPTNYIDLRDTVPETGNLQSISYQTFVNLDKYASVTTNVLRVNASLSRLRIKTLNMDKSLLSGKKVKIKLYFYSYIEDKWYTSTYEDDYTGAGKNYAFSPSVTPYIKANVSKSSSGVKSFDLVMFTFATA